MKALNGQLKDLTAKELINKVKERRTSIYTERESNGNVYCITLGMNSFGDVNNPEYTTLDIILNNEERIVCKTFNSWEELDGYLSCWIQFNI